MESLITKFNQEIRNLGIQCRYSEAILSLESGISELLQTLGLIWYNSICDLGKSEKFFKLATQIHQGNWAFHINLAHVLNLQFKYEEAKFHALKAVEYSKNNEHYDIYYNLGVILANLKEHDLAINAYKKAICLSQDDSNLASYNISASYLITEQWKKGWESYENRFKTFLQPKAMAGRFNNLGLSGKTIYLFSEQGIGDLIQFSRYIPNLKKMGYNLIIEPQFAIAELLKNSFNIKVNPRKEAYLPELPKFDSAVSICSLASIFEAGIKPIPIKPYIKPLKRIKDLKTKKFKVGICWSGNPNHPHDNRRSIPFQDFLPLTNLNIQLFSLQQEKQEELLKYSNIIDLSDRIKDFSDTAHYINQMDLVISVDTSVGHLSGAMGKKTWLLIDYLNDWRWGLSGDKTIWYPSMTLFRQKKLFDWKSVIDSVMDELIAYQKE